MLPSGFTFWSQGQPQGLGPVAWNCFRCCLDGQAPAPGLEGLRLTLYSHLASLGQLCSLLDFSEQFTGRSSSTPYSAILRLWNEKPAIPSHLLLSHVKGEENILFTVPTTNILQYFKTKTISKSRTFFDNHYSPK